MTTKHTPGPWEVHEESYGDEHWFGGDGCGQIQVNGWVNGGCRRDTEAWAALQADARLIGSAPELLEALQLTLKALEAIRDEMTVGERYTNAGQYLLDSLNPARDAIAKATNTSTGNSND